MNGLHSALSGKRMVICAGAGGVGKTTVSATVALGLAARGRRVALVTIDPARRLAEALGLDALGNRPQVVDMGTLGGSGVEMQGELAAMMLDAKRTFDELIGLLAPTPAARDEILANPVYQHISTAVAGSQEYTAIAKLYELEQSADYDVIVLDTPPSRHAIDFLDAPDRLIGFLEGRALAVFMRPTGHAIRAAGVAFSGLRRITGTGLLDDLTSFFRLLSELLDGFRRRAAAVRELLMNPSSGFLIVTSPERAAVDEALFLAAELDRAGMHRAGMIVNRVHSFDPTDPGLAGTAARLTPILGSSLAERTARTHAEVQRLAQRDAAAIARLRSALTSEPVSLAERPSDVHDIPGLMALHGELFERDDEPETHRQIAPVGLGDGEHPALQHG
jgi:anion-transporting  ArsA/GET3 family ATPase